MTSEGRPVGVVEVKKPEIGVLIEPTVLGELFDQMLLVEGFYGTGPICGILTTGEDWMVAWLPTDDAHFQSIPSPQQETGHLYSTPQKSSTRISSHSPPGGTPSQCFDFVVFKASQMHI